MALGVVAAVGGTVQGGMGCAAVQVDGKRVPLSADGIRSAGAEKIVAAVCSEIERHR